MYLKNPLFNPFFADYYYFFEFGAVPKSSRFEFREKLLKRKGALYQKNITLFDNIELILSGKESYKNINIQLASKMNCSLRMLDCHKSRLLKQLRAFYFNWQDNNYENKTEYIERKIKIGMLKEAKSDLIELEKEHDKKRKNLNNKLILFIISENLIQFYSYSNDRRKTEYYYKKAYKLKNSINKTNASSDIKQDIAIRFILLEVHKLTTNRFKLKNLQKAISKLEQLKKEFKNSLNPDQLIKIHHRLGQLYFVFNNKTGSKDEFISALELSRKNGLLADELVYTSFIMLREFADDNSLAVRSLEFHKNNLDKILECCTDISQIMDFELNYLRFLIYTGDPFSEYITRDFINRQILYSRKTEALNSWYLELSDVLSSSIVIWAKNEIGFTIKTNIDVLHSFTEMNKESIFRFRNIYAPNVLSILYINLIEQEFWKAKNADFLKTEIYTGKLKRIVKLHKINISISWIETAALGLEMFEYSKFNSSAKVTSKFSSRLKILTGKLTAKTQTFNLSSDFAKLLFIKQELKIDEITGIINDFEQKVHNTNPDLINELNKLVKSENN